MNVKTVCIEVAILIIHKDEKYSLFSEDKLKSVSKKFSHSRFQMKISIKVFPMLTVKTVCIEVAFFISHKDEKTSLFSEEQLKVLQKVLSLSLLNKNQHKNFCNHDCDNCLYRGNNSY